MNKDHLPRSPSIFRALALGLALLSPGALSGCWSSGAKVVEDQALSGAPVLSLTQAEGMHVIAMQAPSPGWDISFDRAEKSAGPMRVLVTIRRPDPTLIYPQVMVEKLVTTNVELSELVGVFGRVIDHHDRTPDANYRKVAIAPRSGG